MKKITCIMALCGASLSFAQITDSGFENVTSASEILFAGSGNPVGEWFAGSGNDGADDAFLLETTTVNSGNQALIMDNFNGAVKLYNNLTLAPNTTYTFSARVRNYEESFADTENAVEAGDRIVFQLLKNWNGGKAAIANTTTTGDIHNGGFKTAGHQLSHTEFTTVAFDFTTDEATTWTLQINVQPGFDVAVILDDVTVTEGTLSKTDLSKFNFSYAPNPANNVINLNAAKTISKVEFYNTLGQNVLTSKVGALNSTINIQSLNKGIYVMNVTIDGQTQGFKILKQ